MRSFEVKLGTGTASEATTASQGAFSGLPYAPDDAALIRQAQAGHWEAFVEVASRYDRPILALALRLAHSEREARDLFQKALVQTYRELRSYRFQCSFYLWIYRIVARTCLEFLMRRAPATNGRATRLQEALDQLSPRERIVLELKQYFDLRLDTVATILGIDEVNARNILIRATLVLRLELEAHGSPNYQA
jgi:RNA polymerase sigma-70 factor, ECF subfamily